MKVSEAIFTATAKNGKLVWHNVYDLERFLIENEDMELYATFKQSAKLSKKYKMYAFYYHVVLACAVIGFTRQGYTQIDKVKADYLLRAELAKDFILKPDGTTQIIMMDKSNMTQARLFKLLQDAIHYIEEHLEMECPDSNEYKVQKESGRGFKEVK